MNNNELVLQKKRKHNAIKQLYKKLVSHIQEECEGCFLEYNVHNIIMWKLDDFVEEQRKMICTEREYNEYYGSDNGGSDKPKYEKSMSENDKELFELYKNDETFTGVNGTMELLADFKLYAKQMYEIMPNNKTCKMIYAELAKNDELYEDCEKEFEEIFAKDKTNEIAFDLENQYVNCDCVRLDIASLSKTHLEVLTNVIKNKIEYYVKELKNCEDWKKLFEYKNLIEAHRKKLQQINEKLNLIHNNKETQTEKE